MSDLPDFQKLRHNPKHHLGLGDVRITVAQQEAIEQRIAELEAELTTSRKEWNSLLETAEARLDAVAPALRMAFQIAEMERWNDRFPKIFGVMSKALEARDEDK